MLIFFLVRTTWNKLIIAKYSQLTGGRGTIDLDQVFNWITTQVYNKRKANGQKKVKAKDQPELTGQALRDCFKMGNELKTFVELNQLSLDTPKTSNIYSPFILFFSPVCPNH
jgi:hypothetical protein